MQKLRITIADELTGNEIFSRFLNELPDRFASIGREVHHGRNILKIIDVEELGIGMKEVMVKRYHGLFWFQKLDYTFFRKPKCRKAYDNTAELRRRGFDAARELAVVEVWNHGLFQYAFFVSAVGLGLRLDTIVMRAKREGNEAVAQEITRQFAAFVALVHERGIVYHDMNPGNVMCYRNESEQAWHFCLIDTNRTQFFSEDQPLSVEECIGDLILINPKLEMAELFISEYLRCRDMYSAEEAERIREVQRNRYEKRKHCVKNFLKRYKQQYYRWLGK